MRHHQQSRVVVFDVDNTLVKGHLITHFIRRLLFYNPASCFAFIPIVFDGLVICLYFLPKLIRRSLVRQDFKLLDRGMRRFSYHLLKRAYAAFAQLNLARPALQRCAKQILFNQHFHKLIHPHAMDSLVFHVKEPDTVVILASGAMRELLDGFLYWLQQHLEQEYGICPKRLFVLGTYKKDDGRSLIACVGSTKQKMVVDFLKKKGIPHKNIARVYTDNGFLADLPLLELAHERSFVVGDYSRLYRFVPSKWIDTITFWPGWQME
jgi:phosphoserine phosphatase